MVRPGAAPSARTWNPVLSGAPPLTGGLLHVFELGAVLEVKSLTLSLQNSSEWTTEDFLAAERYAVPENTSRAVVM
jgi:hypothetical protein